MKKVTFLIFRYFLSRLLQLIIKGLVNRAAVMGILALLAYRYSLIAQNRAGKVAFTNFLNHLKN